MIPAGLDEFHRVTSCVTRWFVGMTLLTSARAVADLAV